jgi:hypothetical protein
MHLSHHDIARAYFPINECVLLSKVLYKLISQLTDYTFDRQRS